MSKPARAVIGAVTGVVLGYLAVAFVAADAWWIRDIWSWTQSERIAFLYGCIFAVLPGAAIGGWA